MSSQNTKLLTDMGDPQQGQQWYYTPLVEPNLSSELARLSFASTTNGSDSISFQPCPNPHDRSQDRHVISQFTTTNHGLWKYLALFDGHAGHDVADHLVAVMQPEIQSRLNALQSITVDNVSSLLVQAIKAVDDRIVADLKDLFPTFEGYSIDKVKTLVNEDVQNLAKIHLCMRGSTVLISLIHPDTNNLWVASLGDSQAVLGWKTPSGEIDCRIMSAFHNGTNLAEVEIIRNAHPGEPECVTNGRVLGSIAVTRAVGDLLFKVPREYTDKVFKHAKPGFRFSKNVDQFLHANLTPPYLSNVADVQHAKLDSIPGERKVLIMSSDGFGDLYYRQMNKARLKALGLRWVKQVLTTSESEKGNLALNLIRDGIGGDDTEKVSWNLTVECGDKWMDDVTIIVDCCYWLTMEPIGDDNPEEVLYVNPKQYVRILHRRRARARLDELHRLSKQRKPYLHESRHKHAMRRPRGPGGRFLTAQEIAEQQNTGGGDTNLPKPPSKGKAKVVQSTTLVNGYDTKSPVSLLPPSTSPTSGLQQQQQSPEMANMEYSVFNTMGMNYASAPVPISHHLSQQQPLYASPMALHTSTPYKPPDYKLHHIPHLHAHARHHHSNLTFTGDPLYHPEDIFGSGSGSIP